MSERFDFEPTLKQIPASPGCYLMQDRQGVIVYVGKAIDLHSRVRQYFTGGDTRPFVEHLPRILGAIDVVLTKSEKEAILLENTLIKRHRPRFNFKLRDDKEFLRLRIDRSAEWPWVQIVRRPKKDGASYFGPYHSATACRQTLRVLNRYFTLRTCRDSVLHNRSRPCLQYQIHRCPAPCVLDIDHHHYMENVDAAVYFLQARHKKLVQQLKRRMKEASRDLEFERAARLRDQIAAVEKVLQRQEMVLTHAIDQDVFALYREGARITAQVLYIRGGRLQGGDLYHFEDQLSDGQEILSQLLMQHYGTGAYIPEEVVLEEPIASASSMEELLGEVRSTQQGRNRKVRLQVPKRGARRELVRTAQRNAQHQFVQHHTTLERAEKVVAGLREALELERLPKRIECFDISNTQASAIVASMVVFRDGTPSKRDYRSYRIRDTEGQDDFGALNEAVTRRYRRLAEEDVVDEESTRGEQVPDLLLIDGGKGQLGAVMAALQDLGIEGAFDVASIAKSRTMKASPGEASVRHSPERLFRPNRDDAVLLPRNSDELFLVQRVRDEAHRFAIGHHRKLRKKSTIRTQLEDVPGVGPKRASALLKAFGSLAGIRRASVDALASIPGMTAPVAARILEELGR